MMTKSITFLAGILSMVSLFSTGQDWECAECPKRSVAVFGLDVQVSEADAEEMGLTGAQYEYLFMAAGGVLNALMNEDPSVECLSYKEGALAQQLEDEVENPQIGEGGHYVSLPPPPGSLSENYILTGAITKMANGLLSMQVVVRAEETGETVTTAERVYDLLASGLENGKMIGRQLIPLMGKIRDFERSKRDSDPEVVIEFSSNNSGEAEIEPEKEKVKGEEEIQVKLRVTDCDDQPVPNMELELSASGGKIQPTKIKTDGSGEATVTYTAPCEPGKYNIRLKFFYRRPFEKAGAAEGDKAYYETEKAIQVEPGNHFHMHYKHNLTQDYAESFLLNSEGTGVVACTINWDTEPPEIIGTGMVVANWTGNADQCIFSGRSTFRVEYKGKIVAGEGNAQWLEMWKTDENEMGGKFTIDCGGYIQEVPGSMPVPVQEDDRVLKFELADGAANAFDVPGTDTHYSYTLEMGCK